LVIYVFFLDFVTGDILQPKNNRSVHVYFLIIH